MISCFSLTSSRREDEGEFILQVEYAERCESGRSGAPGERVGAKSVPWVRIPPSPFICSDGWGVPVVV